MPRSNPLIIDKTTGEPKTLLFVQTRNEPWKVVVLDRKKHKRKVKKLWSYVEAKDLAAKLQDKYGERVEVHVVSRQVGYGPPFSKIKDWQLLDLNQRRRFWCPYCRKIRKFPRLYGVRRCEFCLCSENDFHFRKCNPIMWADRD